MRRTRKITAAAIVCGLTLAACTVAAQEPTQPKAPPAPPRLPTPVPVPVQAHGWLGFAYRIQSERTVASGNPAEDRGSAAIAVIEVLKGSPADRGGLEPGDTLVQLNGEAITANRISTVVRGLHPGDAVRLQVRRAGKLHDLTLHAAERPAYLSMDPGFGGGMVFGRTMAPNMVFGVPGDSIRRTMRIFLDSARFAMDSIHFPTIVEHRDSMIIMRFGNNSRADTIRLPRMDSMRVQMRKLGRNMDSMRITMRSMPGGGSWEVGGSQPFDFAVAGRRAVAGAELQELNDQLATYFGVKEGLLVEHVAAGTPAARAGLKAGDIVTAADGRPVGDIADLRRALRGREGTVKLDLSRKGKHETLQLKWP